MALPSGISVWREDVPANRVASPIGATQTFRAGDPVQFTGNLMVAAAVADLAALLDGNFIGIAAEDAVGGSIAPSRAAAGLSFGGGPGGAVTGTYRTWIPATSDEVVYATRNFWADPTAAPPTRTAITGASVGNIHPLALAVDATLAGGYQWGLDNGAGTPGTHACGVVIGVLDANNNPVSGATPGTTLLFKIVPTSTALVGS